MMFGNEPEWGQAVRKELTWDDDGQPVLKVKDFGAGGAETELTGMQALKYAPNNVLGTSPNTTYLAPAYFGPDDYRESMSYSAGKGLRDILEDPEPTWIGRIFDAGPVAGSLAGAGTGWLLGHGANWLLKKFRPDLDIPLSTIGLLSGGVLGGLTGYFRNKNKEEREARLGKTASFTKVAMYRDPRNFILERLQGATDISPFEKARLAAKVRQMSTQQAESLKTKVRAAMGFGVGAIIAKFFGAGLFGMGLGGALGAIAGMAWPRGNRKPVGIINGPQYYSSY